MSKSHLVGIVLAMMCLSVFVQPEHRALGEESSMVMKKAKKIKRLVKQGFVPHREMMSILKTGQTKTYAPGDDGDFEKGLEWPESRFIDHGDGTITDKVTGLMWVKNARKIENKLKWHEAIENCNDLVFAGYENWRLPNVRELMSIIDYGAHSPALQKDHPFENVAPDAIYWSSTTSNKVESQAWSVGFSTGDVHRNGKSGNLLYA